MRVRSSRSFENERKYEQNEIRMLSLLRNFPHANILKYLNPISHNPLLMLTLNSSLGICFSPFLGFPPPTSLTERERDFLYFFCLLSLKEVARRWERRQQQLLANMHDEASFEYWGGCVDKPSTLDCHACHQWQWEISFARLTSKLRETFFLRDGTAMNKIFWLK